MGKMRKNGKNEKKKWGKMRKNGKNEKNGEK